ncbi:hypothetical protein ACLFMI_00755 [Pseudonocardia nantongensis]|uniref:hypothetical protein n=1 Tax=Pseudonocardia nantongensis TaxID=1181885 RepID=UPI00397ABEB4
MDDFDEIAAVADAVLFEGYLLYPYRASAQKNRVRWQWGVLMPGGYGTGGTGTGSGETSSQRVECLVEPRRPDARLAVRVRFLHLEQRSLTDAGGREVQTLDVGDICHLAFDEGVPEQVDATLGFGATGAEGLRSGTKVPIAVPGTRTVEELTHPDGTPAGRVVRTRAPLSGTVALRASEVPGPYNVLRLELTVRNDAVAAPGTSRDAALRTALIGTHTMLAVSPGAFLSPTDPPEWAAALVAGCAHEHAWPVLAGPPERSDLLLCTPIILSDHPQLAPESSVNLFDGTENDEILTLRTMVLTEAEKAEARATDPRAAAIVDAVDALPPEMLERLHGAIRSLEPPRAGGAGVPTLVTPGSGSAGPSVGADSPAAAPPASVPWWDPGADSAVDPETDSVAVGGVEVSRGSAVVLRPGRRPERSAGGTSIGTERSACGTSIRTDAQDAFLAGMRATVQAVVHDVDGGVHVAVSVDDDPAAELQLAHGRFRYFRPDELEPAR